MRLSQKSCNRRINSHCTHLCLRVYSIYQTLGHCVSVTGLSVMAWQRFRSVCHSWGQQRTEQHISLPSGIPTYRWRLHLGLSIFLLYGPYKLLTIGCPSTVLTLINCRWSWRVCTMSLWRVSMAFETANQSCIARGRGRIVLDKSWTSSNYVCHKGDVCCTREYTYRNPRGRSQAI